MDTGLKYRGDNMDKFDMLFKSMKERAKVVDDIIFELLPEKEPKSCTMQQDTTPWLGERG